MCCPSNHGVFTGFCGWGPGTSILQVPGTRRRRRDLVSTAAVPMQRAMLRSVGLGLLLILGVGLLPAPTRGHGMLVTPPSRNAVDRYLPRFLNGQSPQTPCTCPNAGHRNASGDHGSLPCDQGKRAAAGGQPCLWWSQGCTIGCDKCTGDTKTASGGRRLCSGTLEPTLPAWAKTMAVGSDGHDAYRYNPWRAPGAAPVVDSCGQAGGTLWKYRGGGADAVFTNTSIAQMGQLGSKVLPYAPSGTKWMAGSAVEVGWAIRYNHGGGECSRAIRRAAPPSHFCAIVDRFLPMASCHCWLRSFHSSTLPHLLPSLPFIAVLSSLTSFLSYPIPPLPFLRRSLRSFQAINIGCARWARRWTKLASSGPPSPSTAASKPSCGTTAPGCPSPASLSTRARCRPVRARAHTCLPLLASSLLSCRLLDTEMRTQLIPRLGPALLQLVRNTARSSIDPRCALLLSRPARRGR